MGRLAAIIVAGGESRRFGSDKLALVDSTGQTLLDRVVCAAAALAEPVIVVGPQRPVGVHVCWAREDPPGGGPAAAVVAGLRLVPPDCERVAVLAGDSPQGPRAIEALDLACVGAAATLIDAGGREQPITAVYDVAALRAVVEQYGDATGMSVRVFLDDLRPQGVTGVADTVGAADDVDRPADAERLGFASEWGLTPDP